VDDHGHRADKMSPLLTPEFRRADESKQREAGTDGQTTVNQERELRDVAERRGWREDRAQLRDGVPMRQLQEAASLARATLPVDGISAQPARRRSCTSRTDRPAS